MDMCLKLEYSVAKDGVWMLVDNHKAMTHIYACLLYILCLIISIPDIFVYLILFCFCFLAGFSSWYLLPFEI
jgi:hypothetical protein